MDAQRMRLHGRLHSGQLNEQALAKIKDRQAKGGKNPRPGRKLTTEDITHYCKIVTAIHHTIRLMKEIDEVIEQHGGWPDAFVTEKSDS